MDVKAENLLIENLFTKGQLIIPDYQREYDWDDLEIEEFINDIQESELDEKYFIGHMVFEGDFNGTKFDVIDGQQRITTITILLCVIRDLLYELKTTESIKLADAINIKYVFNTDKDGNEFEVLRNDMPYPILQTYVQSKPIEKDLRKKPSKSGERKIVNSYDKLKKIFCEKSVKELTTLRDKILNMEFIFVAVKKSEDGNGVDAHEIFMTLNATGKDLTPLDLMKSRIYKLYPKKAHIREPKDSWNAIIKNVGENQKKFINNFWASRYRKVSDKKIFKEFVKEIVKKKVNIKDFLSTLLNDSEIFRKIYNPCKEDWRISQEISIYYSLDGIINVFNVDVANSIIISLIREYSNKLISLDYMQKGLKSIERFHFINNAICSNRSSGLDIMYSKIARDLKDAPDKHQKHIVIDYMRKKLNEKLPPIDIFEANFDEKLFYTSIQNKRKSLVRYALKKLEFSKNRNADLIDVSIEHIYPEKPKVKELENKIIGNLGNLVLLDRKLNSDERVGNKSFNIKKPIIIKESHIITTKSVFSQNNSWGKTEIEKRKKVLIKELYETIWQ